MLNGRSRSPFLRECCLAFQIPVRMSRPGHAEGSGPQHAVPRLSRDEAGRASKLLNRLAQWLAVANQLGSMVVIDFSLYETHHGSCHDEQRCRHYASRRIRTANAMPSRSAKRSPKLATRSEDIHACVSCWPTWGTTPRPTTASRGGT